MSIVVADVLQNDEIKITFEVVLQKCTYIFVSVDVFLFVTPFNDKKAIFVQLLLAQLLSKSLSYELLRGS